MNKYARLRLIADYLAATRNEIAVDEMLLSLSNLSNRRAVYIPRVSKWVGWTTGAHLYFIWLSIACFWVLGGAIIYFLFDLVNFSIKHIINSLKSEKIAEINDGAILDLSPRAATILDSKNFSWTPKIWISFPWSSTQEIPQGKDVVPFISIVTGYNIFTSFVMAIQATYLMFFKKKYRKWMLQSYTAFRWFLVFEAIEKITGNLIIVNHFDRWAVLVDRRVRIKRRKECKNIKFIIVQHGTLKTASNSKLAKDFIKNLPTKISEVDTIYALNEIEKNKFVSNILYSKPNKKINCVCYKSTLHLSEISDSKHPTVLFVGHPMCENFQISVYQALLGMLNFTAFYKPHPRSSESIKIRNAGWDLITDSKKFPRVDLIISYPSTLVDEYRQEGIPAVVHSIDENPLNYQNTSNKAILTLQKSYSNLNFF